MNIGIVYYLAGVSRGLCIAAGTLSIVSIVIAIIGTISFLNAGIAIYDENGDHDNIRKGKKFVRRMWLAGFVLMFLSIVIPDRKDILAMYVVPKIQSNERIQMLSEKALDKIESILECDIKKEELK